MDLRFHTHNRLVVVLGKDGFSLVYSFIDDGHAWETCDGNERGRHLTLALTHAPRFLRQVVMPGMRAHHPFISQPLARRTF